MVRIWARMAGSSHDLPPGRQMALGDGAVLFCHSLVTLLEFLLQPPPPELKRLLQNGHTIGIRIVLLSAMKGNADRSREDRELTFDGSSSIDKWGAGPSPSRAMASDRIILGGVGPT